MQFSKFLITALTALALIGAIPEPGQSAAKSSAQSAKTKKAPASQKAPEKTKALKALEEAVEKHDHETFVKLLAQNPSANKNELLRIAVDNDDISIMKMLLDSGADPNYRFKNGNMEQNLSFIATVPAVKLLIYYGTDVHFRTDQEGITSLHVAAKLVDAEMCSLLIQHGLNASSRTLDGKTPLHSAVEHTPAELFGYFFNNKQGKLFPDEAREDLLRTIEKDQFQTISLLLASGADPNASDKNGNTALHYAAYKGNAKIVQQLINYVYVNIRNKAKCTPLHLAAYKNYPDVAEMLIQGGANAALKNLKGHTVLDIINEQPERVKRFKSNGVFWKINDAVYNSKPNLLRKKNPKNFQRKNVLFC